jgi:ketosteroid isomerase-like protein
VGHAGFRELQQEFEGVFEAIWTEPDGFTPAGDHVVVSQTTRFRGRGGVEVTARGTMLFLVRDGKIASLTLYQERAEAFEALGLRE